MVLKKAAAAFSISLFAAGSNLAVHTWLAAFLLHLCQEPRMTSLSGDEARAGWRVSFYLEDIHWERDCFPVPL